MNTIELPEIFKNKVFDIEKFVNHPKCTNAWSNLNGAGCLLTAFFRAFGFGVNKGDVFDAASEKVRYAPILVTELAESLGFVKESQIKLAHHSSQDLIPKSWFGDKIMWLYDCKQEVEAIHVIWELIDRLPNKVGGVSNKLDIGVPGVVCESR